MQSHKVGVKWTFLKNGAGLWANSSHLLGLGHPATHGCWHLVPLGHEALVLAALGSEKGGAEEPPEGPLKHTG